MVKIFYQISQIGRVNMASGLEKTVSQNQQKLKKKKLLANFCVTFINFVVIYIHQKNSRLNMSFFFYQTLL